MKNSLFPESLQIGKGGMDRLMAMRVFVTVVGCGSQSAAAVQLNISRPRVSRYLAELEEWVGARLLHRTTRRLSLTSVGDDILERCRQMLNSMEDLRSFANPLHAAPKGLLRISTGTSFGPQLARLVTEYGRRYPDVMVDLVMLDRTVDLVAERIDLAIRMTTHLAPSLIARQLAVCRSSVCASPLYLNERGAPQQIVDLERHNCLTHFYMGKSLWQFERAGQPASVLVHGNISANEARVLLHATLEGAGIACLPAYMTAPYIASGRLVGLLPEYEPLALNIYGVYASRRYIPATLRTMLDFLAQRFQEAGWADA